MAAGKHAALLSSGCLLRQALRGIVKNTTSCCQSDYILFGTACFFQGETMIITKIEPQKKHKNRSSVFIDGSFAFGLSDFDVLKFRLKEGKTITEAEISALKSDVLIQDAKQYALRLLDRHTYTEKAIERKLTERGSDPETIESVLAFLKEYQYINDEQYARQYVESALRTGKSGMRKIRYDLAEKGISRDVIDKILNEQEEAENSYDESEAVLPLLEKKLKGDFSFQNLMKAKRYCLSRGFSSDAIDSAVRKLKIEVENENNMEF